MKSDQRAGFRNDDFLEEPIFALFVLEISVGLDGWRHWHASKGKRTGGWTNFYQ